MNLLSALTPVTLDSLPAFSSEVIRMLNDSQLENVRSRSANEVLREYEYDKWGVLHDYLINQPLVSLELAESQFFSDLFRVGSSGTSLYFGSELRLHENYMNEAVARLRPYVQGRTVVEIGAGYGAMTFRLLDEQFDVHPKGILALELTASGRKCLEVLGGGEPRLTVGAADINQRCVSDESLPEDFVIITSMVLPYLECDKGGDFLSWVLNQNPQYVLHIEPLYSNDPGSLMSYLRSRYLSWCSYEGSLMFPKILDASAAKGQIEILHREIDFAGANALLPASFLCWQPT